MSICELCEKQHDGLYGSGRFCSSICARAFSTKKKRVDINEKVSASAKKGWANKRKNWVNQFSSLVEISNSTVKQRILRKMGVGCSRCGWKEGSCDFHHIRGRKIPNANSGMNVTYVCPNCHRLFHEKKIGPDDVIPLDVQVGTTWKEFY